MFNNIHETSMTLDSQDASNHKYYNHLLFHLTLFIFTYEILNYHKKQNTI